MYSGFICRVKRTTSFRLGFLVIFGHFLFPALTQAQVATFDFENGNLQGWTLAGNAFGCQPTRVDNPLLRGAVPSGHQGNYWVSTYGCTGPGTGDSLVGFATYGPFQIQAGTLSFLIGGSSNFGTRVEFLVGDAIEQRQVSILHASGQGPEAMRRVNWDLRPYAGKRGFIRIVDEPSNVKTHIQPRGHVNVDDFRFVAATQTGEKYQVLTGLTQQIIEGLSHRGGAQAPSVKVPQLVRHSLEEVPALLKRARLRLGTVNRKESPEKAGIVIEQDPPAGKEVPQDTIVTVVVATEQWVVVPDLVGHIAKDAQDIIVRTGLLRFAVSGGRESPESPGTVLEQNPLPRTRVHPGTTVNVILATEIYPVVPNLVGHDLRQAEEMVATTGGLVFAVRGGRESPQSPGIVLEQNPLPGTRVQHGTTVGVILAVERNPVVPNLIGRDVREAEKMVAVIHGLKFSVQGRRESPEAPDTVLEQTPLAGARVQAETTVGVVVAIEPNPVVPDLMGRNVREAEKVVAAIHGLEFAVRGQRESSRTPDTVIEQSPTAGSKVRAGTVLKVIVAKGQIAMVIVPALVGRSKEEAEQIVANTRGLQFRVDRERISDAAPGMIIAQHPPPGTTVPAGSTVGVEAAKKEMAVSVQLHVDPPKAKAGSSVVFTVEVAPRVADLYYVFDFDDETGQSTSTEPFIRHTYSSIGTHRAVVVVRGKDVPSSSSNVVPVTIEPGLTLALLVWIITGIGVVAGGSYYKTEPARRRRQLRRAGVSLKPVKSLGIQELEPPPAGSVTSDIRLTAVSSAGEQTTEGRGSLVTREEVLYEGPGIHAEGHVSDSRGRPIERHDGRNYFKRTGS